MQYIQKPQQIWNFKQSFFFFKKKKKKEQM